ncbi:HEAT repeat domain-containing protein [Archangium lansingense]|uniref:HEAT repeat domain-containing protein n=1 Tax=Archangium lansingense TaxID=2995310 RepID=A0ABT4ABY2_9BACT|nr:HEAT repeat domain-containing protein [Archangium lansinium]MCY1078739.1 HEAT repeat domain-containing protein [Archangium lansinium]
MRKLRALSLLLLLTGCGAPRAYQRARDADTLEAYRAFLREYPEGDDAEAIEVRVTELEFEEASKLHTVLAYKRFLEANPEGPQARAARALLEGLRFNAAKDAGTAAALRQFLRDHPDGAQREEAQRLLKEAELKELSTTKDTQQLREYLRESPEDPRRLRVEARLDDESFARAETAGAGLLFAYLRDFQAGRYREQAKVRLLELEVEGLLVSGLLEEAEARVAGHPLGAKLKDFPARLARARAERVVLRSSEPLVQSAQVGHYLRSIEDLRGALLAPDPMDRWQAAEELGQHVSVKALDPLLETFRAGRNPLIRQRALDGLRTVLRALPKPVADYEVAVRLESLREKAGSPELYVSMAALLDLSGRLGEASTEYQRAFVPEEPDPVVLRRWVQLREERRQSFSAAVAARQLALWALRVAREESISSEGNVPLAASRQLCAAVDNARIAAEAIARARQASTEFPEDLDGFALAASDALKLAEARLADAELLLRERSPGARTCGDDAVRERLESAVSERREALRAVGAKLPKLAPLLLEVARERDPSPEIRAEAAARLTALQTH